jgi:uncharacterized membrane protein YfbV (UPF0208 family)
MVTNRQISNEGWIKWTFALMATFIGTALISWMVYSVPKLNEISAGQAAILTSLKQQDKYQNLQDVFNKAQMGINLQVAEALVEIQTAIQINHALALQSKINNKYPLQTDNSKSDLNRH